MKNKENITETQTSVKFRYDPVMFGSFSKWLEKTDKEIWTAIYGNYLIANKRVDDKIVYAANNSLSYISKEMSSVLIYNYLNAIEAASKDNIPMSVTNKVSCKSLLFPGRIYFYDTKIKPDYYNSIPIEERNNKKTFGILHGMSSVFNVSCFRDEEPFIAIGALSSMSVPNILFLLDIFQFAITSNIANLKRLNSTYDNNDIDYKILLYRLIIGDFNVLTRILPYSEKYGLSSETVKAAISNCSYKVIEYTCNMCHLSATYKFWTPEQRYERLQEWFYEMNEFYNSNYSNMKAKTTKSDKKETITVISNQDTTNTVSGIDIINKSINKIQETLDKYLKMKNQMNDKISEYQNEIDRMTSEISDIANKMVKLQGGLQRLKQYNKEIMTIVQN